MADKPLQAIEPTQFTIWPYLAAGYAPDDARRYIRRLMMQHRVGITPEVLDGQRFGGQQDVIGKVSISGTVPIKVYYDGSGLTGPIVHGSPLVFDTVTGQAATGINPNWTIDEYKVIGSALGNWNAPNPAQFGIVQATLMEDKPVPEGAIIARAYPAFGFTWPTVYNWSASDPAIPGSQAYVWTAELPADLKFDPQFGAFASFGFAPGNVWQGSGNYVYFYNLTRQYVHAGSYIQLIPAGVNARQYYAEYYMTPTVVAKLLADLNEGDSANAELITSCQQGFNGTFISVDDRMLKTGKRLKKDTEVWCSVYRYMSGTPNDFVWRFGVIQAMDCPDAQATGP